MAVLLVFSFPVSASPAAPDTAAPETAMSQAAEPEAEETDKLVARALPIDRSAGMPPKSDGFVSDLEYRDDSIHVVIEKTTAYESTCFIAKIKIGHASQLRTETAAQTWDYRREANGERVAQRVNAILAVNGDYYSYISGGYMIRQGVLYRDRPDANRDVLLIDDKGDFHIVPYSTKENLAPYKDMNIIDSFNFGPGLVIDGVIGQNLRNYYNGARENRQRVAIAQAGPLSYYIFVTEARSDGSRGMTLKEFADFVSTYPVQNAYNLDGGNSAQLIFNGIRLNALGFRDVRDINDIVYFASTEGMPDE
ncbi:MAG: phosphodiester glycosidase family protein [Eubacteriales bacterium]|jgi:exopolysaccharide biosynthesis protein|nr:phosphodiester glycosidase family protein [Eubacteriales bacterium]MDD4104909.1 phosphodiester glycosidase family protein [Eubacteriales bacterium]MDD4710063.1 phosphodiester glycosidase family protein [Eubacteriales bacterium]NLO15845.1 phosphodiester glycosidase family protein [Clostridiales bacterium]